MLDTLPLPQSNWIGRPAYERDSVNYPLVTAPGHQGGPQPDEGGGSRLVEDGAGGVFAVWHDSRSGQYQIYVQHLSGGGFPYWTEGGVPASQVSAEPVNQLYPVLTTDGMGGILVFWQEQSLGGTYWQVRGSRVTSSGTIDWEIDLQSALYHQFLPFCISDGSGGALLAWEEDMPTPTGRDVAVAHVLNSGVVSYQGLPLANEQRLPKLAPDGYGGVFLSMSDNLAYIEENVLVARIRSNLSTAWLITVCDSASVEPTHWIVSSDEGEAIVAWADWRNVPTGSDIYAQKIDTSGNILWASWPAGRPICTAVGHQFISFRNNPWVVPDDEGGAIIAWEDLRTAPGNVYAQRVGYFGNTLWTSDGELVCDVKFDGGWGGIVSDGYQGAIMCWCDGRDGLPDAGCNIYVQRIYRDGSLARPEEACEFMGVWSPNVFSVLEVTDVWDMEKQDWCLCQSLYLPDPPYIWCPAQIAGTIVLGFTSSLVELNYALVCNCMDEEGNPQMPAGVYYLGTVPLGRATAVACDDRGPEVENKSFWWGDDVSEVLLHTDQWGNVLDGPFLPSDLGIVSFPVTGLTKDEVNHHLWAICRGAPDVFYEFDITNPWSPILLQGPLPVPWSVGDIQSAGGLEYNTAAHRLMAISTLSRTAECFRDNDPAFPGGDPWPGVDFISACELLETSHPFGLAVKDGRGPNRRGVLEVIDRTAAGTFPLLAYEPPCTFPVRCRTPVGLVIKVEGGAIVLRWRPVVEALTYNIYQGSEPFPATWVNIGSTPDTSYVFVPPAQMPKSFFHVTSVCTEVATPLSGPLDAPRCQH